MLSAGHVDELAGHEVIDSDFSADGYEVVGANAELQELALGLNFWRREMAAIGLGHTLDL